MEDILNELSKVLGAQLPSLIGAMVLLVIGWMIAHMLASMGRRLVHQTSLDTRIAGWLFPGEPTKAQIIQKWTSNILFFLVMLLVIMGVLQTLQLTQINEPLNRLVGQVFEFLPRVFSAGILAGVAWVLATLLRLSLVKALTAMRFDERFQDQTALAIESGRPLSQAIGETVYWLILLFFLPAILGALAVEGLMEPIRGLTDAILQFLPHLFAAGLLLGIGWVMARMIQRIVANVLAAVGADQFAERVGLDRVLGEHRLSNVIGLLLYVLILIPVLIGALNALHLDAITAPASTMLETMLGIIPNVVGAGLILFIAYIIGRVVSRLVSNLLDGLGFDAVFVRLGLAKEQSVGLPTSPSSIVGTLLLVAVILFASIEAADALGLEQLAELIVGFTIFAGHLLLGLIALGIGLYFANLAATTIRASGAAQAPFLAIVARLTILALATAMALRQMGLADEIVNLAFGLTLGALAAAFALAVGLGGKEVVAQELKAWVDSVKHRDR
ncbi:MAG: hypothetical protein D6704_12240 [Nitrospirae bacterium]|nr:MAG: hypothetical protein D6704_12240 [Nitrospirota bacterium]